jgi:hypothetical protein
MGAEPTDRPSDAFLRASPRDFAERAEQLMATHERFDVGPLRDGMPLRVVHAGDVPRSITQQTSARNFRCPAASENAEATKAMGVRTISLEQVRVVEPCPLAWDDLAGGGGASRFCSHCNRHVHNLSAMPADAAQRVICESAGRLCIAYVPDEQGCVTTLEYAKPKRPRYGWKLVAALGGFGALTSGVLAAVFGAKPAPKPPMPMIMGGAMAPITTIVDSSACETSLPGPGAP